MNADGRIEWIEHRSAVDWVHAAAADIAHCLEAELAAHGGARILLSGGTTPAPVYAQLAVTALDWARITVGLVDERWLSPRASASNTRLLHEHLLDQVEVARFEPLVRPGLSLAESVHAANLEATHAPDACMAVLGMGEDGHTASLFPGAQQLPQVLASERPYAALDASGCPVAGDWPQRITLTPAGLAHARQHLLLLRGQSKRQVLVRALEGEDVLQMPIRVVIGRGNPPLRVHWRQ